MGIFSRQWLANKLDPTHKNNVGSDLAADFLKYGPRNAMAPSWTQSVMSERDKYTGYMYAAVTRRANKVVWLAENQLRTKANKPLMDKAKAKKETLEHPYLKVIDESSTFANDEFWRYIQTFLDIKGEFFLMAVRGKVGNKVGQIKEFKLLRPYEVTVVRDAQNMNVIGYVETQGGMYREIEPHMIIPINTLNPFDRNKPFSMADAATDAQFVLKESSEHMKTTMRRNRKYPGVVVFGKGEVALDEEQVANFKSRMRNKSRDDEPTFAGGSTAQVNWNDMQVDMRKSSLEMVNEIHLNMLSAVSGNSKTKFGIEQSGVTRDTADVQDDLFVSDHAMPALQLILSALNQDYKTNYEAEYKRTGYQMWIDSPLADDKDTAVKEVEIRTKSFDLYTTLRNKGYSAEIAAEYAEGEKELTEIGEPTEEPVQPIPPTAEDGQDEEDEDQGDGGGDGKPKPPTEPPAKPAKNAAPHDPVPPAIRNQLTEAEQAQVEQQEGALRTAVVNVEAQLVAAVLAGIPSLTHETQDDITTEEEQQQAIATLAATLVAFYTATLPLQALVVLARRVREFGLSGEFTVDELVTRYIEETADKAAASHVETVLGDLRQAVSAEIERLVEEERGKITPTAGQTDEDVLELARKKALEGVGQERIQAAIREKFNATVSKTRAQTIARTESRRAYNRAQFEADRQFLEQNDLMTRAYKKWITRGPDPCPYCKMLAARPAIPFMQPFAKLGEVLTATFTKADGTTGVRSMKVGFEDAMSGEIHPNGWCTYQLIIE